jgi:hypothetical protein
MSDKVELIAAAQVNAFIPGLSPSAPPSGIEFKSNFGFKSASRTSAGAYVLELDHKHGADKLVINVTRNNVLAGDIQAGIVGTGDVDSITVNNFDLGTGLGVDTPFFVTVWRVRS